MKINFANRLLQKIQTRFQKYQIVAYNNRTYVGYRPVDHNLYTWLGAKLWLAENGDRTRYVYDLFDVKKQKLVYDYSGMFRDYDRVKLYIKSSQYLHEDGCRRVIFSFMHKWAAIAGDQAASIYFADLMALFNEHFQQYHTEDACR